jgi:hypothetical protein
MHEPRNRARKSIFSSNYPCRQGKEKNIDDEDDNADEPAAGAHALATRRSGPIFATAKAPASLRQSKEEDDDKVLRRFGVARAPAGEY